jgi:hypothetical protein
MRPLNSLCGWQQLILFVSPCSARSPCRLLLAVCSSSGPVVCQRPALASLPKTPPGRCISKRGFCRSERRKEIPYCAPSTLYPSKIVQRNKETSATQRSTLIGLGAVRDGSACSTPLSLLIPRQWSLFLCVLWVCWGWRRELCAGKEGCSRGDLK